MIRYCPACQSQDLELMFDMGEQPMSLVELQDNPEASISLNKHPIKLAVCHQCSHVHNILFDPNYPNYADGCHMYNNGVLWQQHMEHVRELAEGMEVEALIEVGAGNCKFLDSVATSAVKIAVDPSHESAIIAQELGIKHYREKFYPSKHIPKGAKEVGIVMRHLLEHMESPRNFIEEISIQAPDSVNGIQLLIEVPNCEVALERTRIEDWTYEHAQHFTCKSLRTLLRNCGCTDIFVTRSYEDEVMIAIAHLYPAYRERTKDIVKGYRKVQENIKYYTELFHKEILDGNIAFWGGAGKSAMFLRKFDLPDYTLVVDSHDAKWGLYVPGTGIKIKDPFVLKRRLDYKFDLEPRKIIATTSWRAFDISEEIVRKEIPCSGLYKFENGELVEVPLGN